MRLLGMYNVCAAPAMWQRKTMLRGVFTIGKKIAAGILAAGVLAVYSLTAPAMANAAAEQPTEIVAGGNFKIAKLSEDHLTEEYRLAKYDQLGIFIVGFSDGMGLSTTTSTTTSQNTGNTGTGTNSISTNSIMIGPDGYAQLPYVGAVKLAGLTISEATALLTDALGEYIKIPSMSVMIKSYGPRKVYVMGAVSSPGIKEMSIDSLNVFAALSAAGGVNNRGRIKHVQVLRSIGDTMYYKEVNMDSFVKKHDMVQNLALQDGDIVYVPESNKIVFSEDIMPYISGWALYKSITN